MSGEQQVLRALYEAHVGPSLATGSKEWDAEVERQFTIFAECWGREAPEEDIAAALGVPLSYVCAVHRLCESLGAGDD